MTRYPTRRPGIRLAVFAAYICAFYVLLIFAWHLGRWAIAVALEMSA